MAAAMIRRPRTSLRLPRWGWITLAILTAFILLPVYFLWVFWVLGKCPSASARLLEFVAPVAAAFRP